MLAAGKDSALLRFGLGSEHLKRGDPAAAAAHLRQAVELDPKYSAAWKLLGKANEAAGNTPAAVRMLVHGPEDPQWPCSFLARHENIDLLADPGAARALEGGGSELM